MSTIRERVDDYRQAEGDFPETPDDFEVSQRRAAVGAVLAGVTGFICSAPVGWGLLMAAESGLIPYWAAMIAGLSLYFVAKACTKYVGGPVADHLLGIPREVKR